jgi:hemolysin activation/secretion protein
LTTIRPARFKLSLAVLLLALSAIDVQAASTLPPGAGSILQQIQPVEPPSPPTNNPGLVIEQQGAEELPPTAPFLVRSIRIKGNAAFGTAPLHALVRDAEGKSLTLSQLYDLAALITDYYHRHGYPLARAIIPAQTIQEGEVEIEVIEAHYGKIEIDNRSRVKDDLLQATLFPLQSGQAIEQGRLDRSLLLLSDVPGIVAGATLKPGEAVGTSDLLVQSTPGPAAAGNVTLDNYGNRYTGSALIGGELDLYAPLHHGDLLDATVQSSGHDMDYGRVLYDVLLNGAGSHLGGSYSALHYILGESLASLDGYGTARVASLWGKQPLVRTVAFNLYGQLQFDRKQLRDDIGVSGIRTDRHLDNWTASLSGDKRDAILSGGINTWSVGLTSGHVGFDDATAERADAATAKIQGRFLQGNAIFARLQRLTPKDTLYVTLSGQWANTNLDPSQKMVAGGPYTVRAYEMSALTGDSGIQARAEWRRDLLAWHGQWQAVAFLDSEHVTVNKNVWTSGTNDATLSGAGLGLNWSGTHQWSVKGSIATHLGSTPVIAGATSSVRGWIEAAKGF